MQAKMNIMRSVSYFLKKKEQEKFTLDSSSLDFGTSKMLEEANLKKNFLKRKFKKMEMFFKKCIFF